QRGRGDEKPDDAAADVAHENACAREIERQETRYRCGPGADLERVRRCGFAQAQHGEHGQHENRLCREQTVDAVHEIVQIDRPDAQERDQQSDAERFHGRRVERRRGRRRPYRYKQRREPYADGATMHEKPRPGRQRAVIVDPADRSNDDDGDDEAQRKRRRNDTYREEHSYDGEHDADAAAARRRHVVRTTLSRKVDQAVAPGVMDGHPRERGREYERRRHEDEGLIAANVLKPIHASALAARRRLRLYRIAVRDRAFNTEPQIKPIDAKSESSFIRALVTRSRSTLRQRHGWVAPSPRSCSSGIANGAPSRRSRTCCSGTWPALR